MRKLTPPGLLHTDGGVVVPDTVVETRVDEIEKVTALHLEGSPNAIALGQRCAELGYEFWWRPFHRAPVFRRPDGSPVDIEMEPGYVATFSSTTSVPALPTKLGVALAIQNPMSKVGASRRRRHCCMIWTLFPRCR